MKDFMIKMDNNPECEAHYPTVPTIYDRLSDVLARKCVKYERIKMVFNLIRDGYKVEDREKYERVIGRENTDEIRNIKLRLDLEYANECIEARIRYKNNEITKDQCDLLYLEIDINREKKRICEMGDFLLYLAREGE